MQLGTFELDFSVLRSRVARRIFGVFLAGSLVPVTAFALLGYVHVRAQLESDATLSLGREAKTTGMSILERLMIAEVSLRAAARAAELPDEETPGLAAVRVESGLSGLPERPQSPGRVALVLVGDEASPRVEMRLVDAPRDRVVVAELDPEFLFVPMRRRSDERYWVENRQGRLLFVAPDDPALRRVLGEGTRESRERFSLTVGEETDFAVSWPVFLGSAFVSADWHVGVSRARATVLRPLQDFEAIFPLVAVATVALAALLTLVQLRRSLVPLDALSRFAADVGGGDLEARVEIRSRDEFRDLGDAFNRMAAEIRGHVAALDRLNEIGRSLSGQQDLAMRLDLIVDGATELTHAHACGLFLENDADDLEVARVRIFDAEGRVRASELDFPTHAAAVAVRDGRVVRTDGPGDASPVEREEWARLTEAAAIEVGSGLAIPLRVEDGRPLGALVLLSSQAGAAAFPGDRVDLAESLASQAAIAIRQGALVDSLRALFEGLIDLTVRAIDEKSPYTGEHCRKVPILTELIADAVSGATNGPLKDCRLSSTERYELRIAALLHDCGKVVTPVHVMDKATKLETIFDRIELVRARFEILRRDLRIRELETGASEPAVFAAERRRLDADLHFLERVNRGVEFMSDADRARVRSVASSATWTDAGGVEQPLLEDDEVRNLLVRRGTLNAAERKVIEDHVVATIDLLEELPFPRELRNVPAIAGAHHEHIDGTGYPNQLAGDQLDVQSRILGLADVFEALTAKDRPYKHGMPLSQTLAILETMVEQGHIDPDLHELFVREKVYLRYAVEHMDPAQIDGSHASDLEDLSAPWR